MNSPNDEPNQATTPQPLPLSANPPSRRDVYFKPAVLGLVLLSAVLATGLTYKFRPQAAGPSKSASEPKDILARLFPNWGKPDFVVVLSAQQHGYMLPCGCSKPQVGGLERRYNFMQLLKVRGWPIVAVDLGDVPQKTGPAKLPNVQGLIKYRYSMMALKEMGYLAVGLGEYEGALSLARVEGEWPASFAQPAVLAANLKDADTTFPFLKASETQSVAGIKVGVTNVVGPSVAKIIKDPAVQFITPTSPILREQLKKMQAEKVDLPILLYHGLATGQKEALNCAEAFPDFPLILALSEEDEPPAHPIAVRHPGSGASNYVFRLGHKGKYIGVLGVYRNGPSFTFKYKLVEMGEEFMTPKEQESKQPIMKMMEDYTRELKNKNYLKEYVQSKHILQAMTPVKADDPMPTYIGSEACGRCHEHAYNVWKASLHSHAYQTLVDAKHPSLRQYDGECIVCHTVGFGYQSGFTNEKDTAKLENVGCESCHGPGSLHKRNPNNKEWQRRMNLPWAEARAKGDVKAKNLAIEKFCVTCHDIDNDVHWVHGANGGSDPFIEKWEKRKIIHNTPQE